MTNSKHETTQIPPEVNSSGAMEITGQLEPSVASSSIVEYNRQ